MTLVVDRTDSAAAAMETERSVGGVWAEDSEGRVSRVLFRASVCGSAVCSDGICCGRLSPFLPLIRLQERVNSLFPKVGSPAFKAYDNQKSCY